MSKKTVRDLLLTMSLLGTNEYASFYVDDPLVNDCLMSMYFYMLYDSNYQEKKEEKFQEFSEKYNKLNDEQKELVKQDYLNIIEAQDKNKEKVKRKGDKYE